MKLFLIIAIALLASSCTNVTSIPDKGVSLEKAVESGQETPISQRIYYFQHKLIPKWVFESEGEFYFDIYNRNAERLLMAAAEIVSQEYADGIRINPIVDRNAVSISFPEPEAMANCYFVLVQKNETGFSYYTYEKTMKFGDEDFIGVVGGWDGEGSHSNFGPRAYQTENKFIEDVVGQ